MLQEQFDVAGDALRELRGAFERGVERRHLQRMYAGDGGRHGLRRAAEHIDIGIVNGLVPVCRAGVDVHFAGAVLRGVVTLDDVGPQHARRAELGDFEEVVRGDREREAQLAGRQLGVHAGVGQARDVIVTGREGERQLLDDGRSGVREDAGRDGHDTDVLVLAGLFDQRGDLREALFAVGRAEVAFLRQSLDQRVDREGHVRLGGSAFLFELGDHQFGDAARLRAAEDHFDGRDRDSGEQLIEFFGREALLRD